MLQFLVSARQKKNTEGTVEAAIWHPVSSLHSVPAYHSRNQQTVHFKNFIT